MSMYVSRARNTITLVKGSNRKLNDIDEITKSLDKNYNAECGSGFYLAKNIEIAKKYARKIANEYGGLPTINIYSFEIERASKVVKSAFFNELDLRSMNYIGMNLAGLLPKNCPRIDEGRLPRELCHKCNDVYCEWNADYIEAILSEAEYNLDDILLLLVTGKITEEEALLRINDELRINRCEIRLQVMLREKTLKFLTFSDCYTLNGEEDEV